MKIESEEIYTSQDVSSTLLASVRLVISSIVLAKMGLQYQKTFANEEDADEEPDPKYKPTKGKQPQSKQTSKSEQDFDNQKISLNLAALNAKSEHVGGNAVQAVNTALMFTNDKKRQREPEQIPTGHEPNKRQKRSDNQTDDSQMKAQQLDA